ncbi:MAG TPA: hypothetical protein VFU74_12955 [Actinocrinis sp.]|nr:hypothetical protein [Actinocrinis sp.]
MNRFAGLGWFVAMGLLALLLAPVVVLAGDPVLQRHRRGNIVRGEGGWLAAQNHRLNLAVFQFGMHPVVIALTAPARWARPRLRALRRRVRWALRSRAARRRGWDGLNERLFPDDPGLSGVREPRRPNPMPPADAVALRQPTEHSARD